MENELQKAREIFLTGVDEETRAENLADIERWEKGIHENRAFAEWQENDISKMLVLQVKQAYVEISTTLLVDRSMSQLEREKLWAKQDAMLYMLSFLAKNAKVEIENIEREIRQAIESMSSMY